MSTTFAPTPKIDDQFEAEVRQTMDELRALVVGSSAARADLWEWAEEVAIRHLVDECREEFEDSGESMRSYLARDLAFRFGEQLVAMAGDVAPSEPDYAEAKRNLRVAPAMADRLRREVAPRPGSAA